MIKTQHKCTINFHDNGIIQMHSHTIPPKNAIIQVSNNLINDTTLAFNIINDQLKGAYDVSNLPSINNKDQKTDFNELFFNEIWEGIDLTFSVSNGQLKYEFIVSPGANLEDIKFKYNYADKVELDSKGNLIISVNDTKIIDQAPICYQVIESIRVVIKSNYVLTYTEEGLPVVTIDISPLYDPNYSLIIDPYITFLN